MTYEDIDIATAIKTDAAAELDAAMLDLEKARIRLDAAQRAHAAATADETATKLAYADARVVDEKVALGIAVEVAVKP